MIAFRDWVYEMWLKHKDEIYDYYGMRDIPYDWSEYFRQYKWWLKREYKKYINELEL